MKQQKNKAINKAINQAINPIVPPFQIGGFHGIRVLTMLTALLLTLLPAAVELQAAPLESFLLFYSSNIQGETEPCG